MAFCVTSSPRRGAYPTAQFPSPHTQHIPPSTPPDPLYSPTPPAPIFQDHPESFSSLAPAVWPKAFSPESHTSNSTDSYSRLGALDHSETQL